MKTNEEHYVELCQQADREGVARPLPPRGRQMTNLETFVKCLTDLGFTQTEEPTLYTQRKFSVTTLRDVTTVSFSNGGYGLIQFYFDARTGELMTYGTREA